MPEITQAQREEGAANYGWSTAVLNSDPELRKTFRKALKQGWSPQRFIAEIQDTKWFRTRSAAAREAVVERKVDPATWKAKKEQKVAQLRDQASAMGAVLTDAQLSKVASNAMTFGWTDAQLQDTLTTYVGVAKEGVNAGTYTGEAGRNADTLRQIARANGYNIGDDQLRNWNKTILRGDRSVEDYQSFMRQQAALTFPSFKTELEAGMDMADIANPYMNSMARILEINPAEIDLFNPTIRKALASKSEKTGKPEAMAMYDFEHQLRADPRWAYTDNAHKEVLSMGMNFAQRFGVQG